MSWVFDGPASACGDLKTLEFFGYRRIVLSEPLYLAVAPCVENLRIHECIADVVGV